MIKQLQTLLVLGTGLGLVACNAGTEQSNEQAAQNEAAANEALPLPPSIAVTRPYRCADGQTVYVDFMSDDLTVHLRTKQDGDAAELKATEQGGPFDAEGYSVSTNAPETEITLPDAKTQHCKS